ncbi:hypothetical protein [Methylorubrum zatmanii]
MSDTRAIALKPFRGAPDGDAYPEDFEKGDPVEGTLADVAIGEKWAREAKDGDEFAAAVDARTKRLASSEAA